MKLKLTTRDKALIILGMYRAFEAGNFPKHFNRDDRAQWKIRAAWAAQILNGGVYNPMHLWRFEEFADDELSDIKRTICRRRQGPAQKARRWN